MSARRVLRPGWLLLITILAYALFLGVQLSRSYFHGKNDLDRIRHIVASEELILDLNSELSKLSRSIQNLRLPDYQSAALFQDRVRVVDLDTGRHDTVAAGQAAHARVRHWPVGPETTIDRTDILLWQPLLDEVSYFDHAKFYFIDGHFSDTSMNTFASAVGFKGLARGKDGQWTGVKAMLVARWKRVSDTGPSAWRISDWKLESLETIESPQLLFTESLASALPDTQDYQRARRSEHEQAVIQYYRTGARELPWPYFSPISANQRPGLSVVDIDRDGYDDLYIMVRRGRNQLLHNQGDGTFKEVAADWGLDIEHYSSCGIFADFDNDGDPDLMLGRSFQRSMYLENVGQRFVPTPVSDDAHMLPYLVVSMSAADYNGDGLLDVYFCTYRPAVLESIVSDETEQQDNKSQSAAGGSSDDQSLGSIGDVAQQSARWTDEFLTAADASEFEKRLKTASKTTEQFGVILDQVGPPNVLLVNRGHGQFEVAPQNDQVALWRNTLQATWADFDEDGDPDLYVANDWAADNLLRNDGSHGFVDVAKELGITEFGFAMGVTWGDYDRDGLQDIYVSNMYSKAGRRITSQIAELNPDYPRSAEGNFLYRSTQDGFQLVSGLEPPAITVAEAGWSWGGQFVDFNNDGFLDLYVLSGYFSAPDEFASDVDL